MPEGNYFAEDPLFKLNIFLHSVRQQQSALIYSRLIEHKYISNQAPPHSTKDTGRALTLYW